MPKYVQKNLIKYKHEKPKRPQHCSYKPAPRRYAKAASEVVGKENSPAVNDADKKYIKQVLGSFLYYVHAVDLTILQALNAITAEQAHLTERALQHVKQFLDYMARHPEAIIRYRVCNMVLNVHSDASFHSASRAHFRAG